MISEDRLFKILVSPRTSEKSSMFMEKTNTIIFKVIRNAKKIEIKFAIEKIFKVEVKSINTMIVKGKKKRKGNKISCHKNWKKAYITIKKGQNMDLIGGIN